MSTNDKAGHKTRNWNRWAVPGVALTIGLAYLIAGWSSGNRGFAIGGFTVMVVFAAVLLLVSRRSETVAGLLDRRDERINRIDSDAAVFAGGTLIVAVLVGFVVEIARGQDGQPYSLLAAIAGVAYIVAIVVLRLRR